MKEMSLPMLRKKKANLSVIRIHKLILMLFIGVIMVDPTNMISHKKEIAFVGFMAFAVIGGMIKLYAEQIRYSLMLFSLAILSVAIGYIFFDSDLSGSVSYFKALLFVSVAFALSKLTIEDIIKCIFYVGTFLSMYIVGLFVSYTTNIINLNTMVDVAVDADSTVMIAMRNTLGIDMLMFFYKSMPFCLFALMYAMRNNLLIPIIVISISIIIGGSRTPILMGMAVVIYVLCTKSKNVLKYLTPFFLCSALIYLVLALLSVDNRGEGDDLKYKTIEGLLNQSSLFSHGVGAMYFTTERGMVSNSEVTYFEMLFQYGWLFFPLVLYIFFSPVIKIFKGAKDYLTKDFAIAYLAYLVNAGTNPLLINSTGMFVFACAITIMSKVKAGKMKLQSTKVSDNDSDITGNL